MKRTRRESEYPDDSEIGVINFSSMEEACKHHEALKADYAEQTTKLTLEFSVDPRSRNIECIRDNLRSLDTQIRRVIAAKNRMLS